MLVIKDLNGTTEPIADYKDLEINEEVNGDFSLSCLFLNTENNKHAWDIVAEESVIEYEGHEFRIKKKVSELLRKAIVAPHVFFDLIDHQVYSIKGGTMYAEDAFSFILTGTGWTFEITDNFSPILLFNLGEDNALSLIRKTCEAFDCEVKIEPKRHLRICKRVGKDTDYQFRYKHNIKRTKETVDTSSLTTVIKGYGGNGLQVTYTSPNVSVFGERHAEPIKDEDILEASIMTEMLKREIVDTPEVNIELEAVMLEGAELGDKIWLIHEPLGIEIQTRVMAQKRRPKSPEKSVVTLGNRKPTLSDLLTEAKVEINENAKQTTSRISQTNERITLEVSRIDGDIGEANAKIELTADQIALDVDKKIKNVADSVDEDISKVNESLESIGVDVTTLNGAVYDLQSSITQTASEIRSEVSADVERLDGNIVSLNSTISQTAAQISSKVEKTDFNGNTVVSMINQTAAHVSIDASKINLTGYVTINSLGSSGAVTIDSGNIYGSSFVVGKGTGSTLTMTSVNGSHSIKSSDANGFRIESNGTVSLKSRGSLPITMLGFTRVAGDLSVEQYEGATPLLATNHGESKVVVNGQLQVSSMLVNGKPGVPAIFS